MVRILIERAGFKCDAALGAVTRQPVVQTPVREIPCRQWRFALLSYATRLDEEGLAEVPASMRDANGNIEVKVGYDRSN